MPYHFPSSDVPSAAHPRIAAILGLILLLYLSVQFSGQVPSPIHLGQQNIPQCKVTNSSSLQ